ncbi:hypothetical protein [Caulobacter sp. S45]|jgi:hypothetical protein|uniref:hypothetical protein n=1 Tax=Caulobacter sp. S45 TaxID=1641861 RepID=UPI00131A924B|nr:hypothetical protein [Caulobacter sp. S45]
MARTTLLKRVEGMELWTTVTETTQHFAIKTGERRARVAQTLAEAEAFLAAALLRARTARAH